MVAHGVDHRNLGRIEHGLVGRLESLQIGSIGVVDQVACYQDTCKSVRILLGSLVPKLSQGVLPLVGLRCTVVDVDVTYDTGRKYDVRRVENVRLDDLPTINERNVLGHEGPYAVGYVNGDRSAQVSGEESLVKGAAVHHYRQVATCDIYGSDRKIDDVSGSSPGTGICGLGCPGGGLVAIQLMKGVLRQDFEFKHGRRNPALLEYSGHSILISRNIDKTLDIGYRSPVGKWDGQC